MNPNKKMNRKGISIPIFLLVILALALIFFTVFTFNAKGKEIDSIFQVSDELDDFYLKEVTINFYIQEIFDKITRDFEHSMGKGIFIENFKKELDKNKNFAGEFPEIYSEINENNVELSPGKIILKINFKESVFFEENGRNKMEITYEKTNSYVHN
jgi:hypothetical protein